MGQVAVELLRKNINIAPTLVIRPGYRFNVMVVKDLTFKKPYQPFDY
jgi:type IV secretion system protein VirB10